MVINWLDYFQLAYISILFPTYLLFTIRLGFKIYFVKTSLLHNEYYPIIFYKGIIDILTIIIQFATSRIQKYKVFNSFFLNNTYLSYVLYFVTSATYFIMFQIAFLTSFNRYIAISKPILYKKYFNFKQLHIYFFIMSLLGLLVGILSILFPYTYVYFPSLDRVSAVSLDPRTSFLHASCAIFLYLPLIIITTIFNLISIYKNRFFFKKHKDINNVEFKILLYSCLQLFTMIAFEGYYLVRNIPYIIDNFYFLEAIAIQSLSWIVDSMTYGLFIFSLILSPILRSQLLFLNLKQNNKTIKIKTSNMTQRY